MRTLRRTDGRQVRCGAPVQQRRQLVARDHAGRAEAAPLGEDYIRTARAKGLSPLRVVALHAFRNALVPVVTVIGLQVSVLFTGAILTETIFSWPGVGKWMIEAIARRDYPVLQGGLLLLGGAVMLVNLLVDLTYGVINPRIARR